MPRIPFQIPPSIKQLITTFGGSLTPPSMPANNYISSDDTDNEFYMASLLSNTTNTYQTYAKTITDNLQLNQLNWSTKSKWLMQLFPLWFIFFDKIMQFVQPVHILSLLLMSNTWGVNIMRKSLHSLIFIGCAQMIYEHFHQSSIWTHLYPRNESYAIVTG